MNRQLASQMLRNDLDKHDLRDWHIRLIADITKPFLGLCSYKDKCIILNALHVDTHPDAEVINTIHHEVAHALTPGHNHDEEWQRVAKLIGCDNTKACANYGFSEEAIDAIRSGAELKVEFEEQIIRKPKYTIHKLQDKCPTCGKVAKVSKRDEREIPDGIFVIEYLECGHLITKTVTGISPFSQLVFDIPKDGTCKNNKHQWGKELGNDTICQACGAKRLFKYQVEGARALEKAQGRFALLDDTGLGKTIQALAYLKFHPEVRPFLWVTKSGIKYQHAAEIIRILGDMEFPQVVKTGREKLIKGMNCLMSYDMFRRRDLDEFINNGFKCVVLDEVQALKNPDSTRTQCIRHIVKGGGEPKKGIPSIIPLSATFWKNRGSEAFVMLNMLDPRMFHSFEYFKKTEVEYYWDHNKQKEGGIKNPETFLDRIKHIAIRREFEKVMTQVPPFRKNKFECEVPPEVRKVYNEELDNLVKKFNEFVIDGREDSFEAKQAMNQNLMVMRQIIGIAKVPATVEFAQDFLESTNRKLVVFVHHIECGKMIMASMKEWCAANNLPQPLQLDSSLSPEERYEIQQKFNGPNYRFMVASTLASGEGLNLQSCSDCLLHERQWNPMNEYQAVKGRFHRIGQTVMVNATYIHAKDTIDLDLDDIVERKERFFHAAMNKGERADWNEKTDLRSELIRKLVASSQIRNKRTA